MNRSIQLSIQSRGCQRGVDRLARCGSTRASPHGFDCESYSKSNSPVIRTIGDVVVAIGRSANGCKKAPGATSIHTLGAPSVGTPRVHCRFLRKVLVIVRIPNVFDPFQQVAMSVKQPQGIGALFSDRVCTHARVRTKPASQQQIFVPVTDPVSRRRSRATRELPFRLACQPIPCSVQRCDRISVTDLEWF